MVFLVESDKINQKCRKAAVVRNGHAMEGVVRQYGKAGVRHPLPVGQVVIRSVV